MSMVNILIGLMPMIGWGLYPILTGKFGGKPVNQIIGSTYGTFLSAVVVALVTQTPLLSGKALLFTFLSGVCWSAAQSLVFYAFAEMGVSKTMPVSTGFQLIGTSLWGVIVLGEWPGITAKLFGGFAILLIIIGVYLTTYSEKKVSESESGIVKGITLVLIATIGYVGYSAFPQAVTINGFEAFLPQAFGMAVAATVFGFLTKSNREAKPYKSKSTYLNIISGIFFAFAAATYLISSRKDVNGLATGFTLSQMNVIIATLGSIYFLHESKTRKEMIMVLSGLVLVVIAGVITAFL